MNRADLGHMGEAVAAKYYIRQGYLLLNHNYRTRMVELDLQQARYEASLAERRYAACDPDNRLIAAQLENSWEAALRRVEAYEAG